MSKMFKIITVLLLLFCLFGCNKKNSDLGELKVTFLDVGQGDAILVECNGKNMLVDGGDINNNLYLALQEKEINEFEYVFCTHPHQDHIGGLVVVLESEEINVNKFFCSSNTKDEGSSYLDFKKEVEKRNKEIIVPKKGDIYKLSNAEIEVLSVDAGINNDSSIVLKITFGETSLLLTGDIEETAINALMKDAEKIKSDVLKIPHHGAAKSSPMYFLDAVSPEYAIISVGANNKYNHPSSATTANLEKLGVETFITSVNHTIECSSTNGKKIVCSPQ